MVWICVTTIGLVLSFVGVVFTLMTMNMTTRQVISQAGGIVLNMYFLYVVYAYVEELERAKQERIERANSHQSPSQVV